MPKTPFSLPWLAATVLAAVLASLATRALVRRQAWEPGSELDPQLATQGVPPTTPRSGAPRAPVPALDAGGAGAGLALARIEAGLDELRRRVEALELASAGASRSPAAPVQGGDLRSVVLEVLATEREREDALRASEAEEEERAALAFGARMTLMGMGEYALTEGEKDRLVELMVELQLRQQAIWGEVDPRTTDEEVLEARMQETTRWFRAQVEAEFGSALAREMLGEE